MSVLFHYPPKSQPSAPFVLVELGALNGSAALPPQAARVDTGADRTVVPADLIAQLGLGAIAGIVCEGLGGNQVVLLLYRIQLRILGLQPVVVEVASAAGEPHVLLGLDVLNCYKITLDGPNRSLTIDQP